MDHSWDTCGVYLEIVQWPVISYHRFLEDRDDVATDPVYSVRNENRDINYASFRRSRRRDKTLVKGPWVFGEIDSLSTPDPHRVIAIGRSAVYQWADNRDIFGQSRESTREIGKRQARPWNVVRRQKRRRWRRRGSCSSNGTAARAVWYGRASCCTVRETGTGTISKREEEEAARRRRSL